MKIKPRELLEKEAKLLEHYNDVIHYLRAFNIDENLLDDAIQDTFVEALSSLDTLRDETKMKYWCTSQHILDTYCQKIILSNCIFQT